MSAEVNALSVRGLSKRFGGVHALEDVSLDVKAGEIHGLLGENGSGKSTLIKILAGFHEPDAGQLTIYGDEVTLPIAPGEFGRFGVEFVHQELGLMPSLTVCENLWMVESATTSGGWHISWGGQRARATEVFSRYGLELDPRALVEELRPVERALLAIVRAAEGIRVSMEKRKTGQGILVLDEPTVFLPSTGTAQLFSLVREIVSSGASAIFVSHDLAEARAITDRITVLRDGRSVGTVETTDTSEARLIELIIGRKLDRFETGTGRTTESPVQVVAEQLRGEVLSDATIEVHRGEVLGVTGLVGSGFEEIPYILFGAAHVRRGSVTIDQKRYDLSHMTPVRALGIGMALIPSNRQRDGSVLSLSVSDNLTLRTLDSYSQGIHLNRRRMMRDAWRLVAEYDVRPQQPRATFSSLSGGNQQKVLLAKWLQTEPALLLLDEPTQGVDVGARQQIFGLIRRVAREGGSVVCASSDYEQLAAICDRVLVVGRGKIVDELVDADISKERITERCINSMKLRETLTLAGSG